MVKRFLHWLASFKVDEYLHFICSLIICQVSLAIYQIWFPFWLSAIFAVLTTAAAGALKELYDFLFDGAPSWKDFWTDLIGCGSGLVLVLLNILL